MRKSASWVAVAFVFAAQWTVLSCASCERGPERPTQSVVDSGKDGVAEVGIAVGVGDLDADASNGWVEPSSLDVYGCRRACVNGSAIDCAEGRDRYCVDACVKAEASHHVDLKPDCLAAARTQSEWRACGTSRCNGIK